MTTTNHATKRNIPDELDDALGAIKNAKRALQFPHSVSNSVPDALAFLSTAQAKLDWIRDTVTEGDK